MITLCLVLLGPRDCESVKSVKADVGAAEDAFVKQEFLELAAVCEEVANEIDDRRASR